jgi:hypothetical protein
MQPSQPLDATAEAPTLCAARPARPLLGGARVEGRPAPAGFPPTWKATYSDIVD